MKKLQLIFATAMVFCILLSMPLEARKKRHSQDKCPVQKQVNKKTRVFGSAFEVMDVSQILDEVVVINLNRHIHRFYETEAFMAAAGFTNIRRFEAVDGLALNNDSFFEGLNIYSGGPGQKGCAASHLLIWKDFVENSSKEYLFICEDDMLPHSEFQKLFPLYWSQTPKQFDIVMVGNQMGNINSDQLIISQPCFCMHAYIISKQGAKKLLALYEQIPRTATNIHIIDIFLVEMMKKKAIEFYCYNGKMYPDPINYSTDLIFRDRDSGICFQNKSLGSSIHTIQIVY